MRLLPRPFVYQGRAGAGRHAGGKASWGWAAEGAPRQYIKRRRCTCGGTRVDESESNSLVSFYTRTTRHAITESRPRLYSTRNSLPSSRPWPVQRAVRRCGTTRRDVSGRSACAAMRIVDRGNELETGHTGMLACQVLNPDGGSAQAKAVAALRVASGRFNPGPLGNFGPASLPHGPPCLHRLLQRSARRSPKCEEQIEARVSAADGLSPCLTKVEARRLAKEPDAAIP
eukprot:scaffold44635_cov66-Phaeocystis_antarctica.AAC.4